MGMIWDNLWAMYGLHMVLIWDITHHIKPVTERSHIISIEQVQQSLNYLMVWYSYGQLTPAVFLCN